MKATWSNGSVGMIGKSYDGSVANSVAATGVDGLKTVVPIAAISNSYDYARLGGIVRFPDWAGGTTTARSDGCVMPAGVLRTESDDSTGNFNAFWQQRNTVPKVNQWKASVLIAHGLTDTNVLPHQASNLWQALNQAQVPAQLWLYRGGHLDPFDVDRAEWMTKLHVWFDRWLLGSDLDLGPAVRIQDDRPPFGWRAYNQWPLPTAATEYRLGNDSTPGSLGTRAGPVATFLPLVGEGNATQAAPEQKVPGRLVYITEPLTSPTTISGIATLRLNLTAQRSDARIVVHLIDYGPAERMVSDDNGHDGAKQTSEKTCGFSGPGQPQTPCYPVAVPNAKQTDFGVLASGWHDVLHTTSYETVTPHQPGQPITLTIRLTPTNATVPAGHRIGLVIAGNDPTQFFEPPASVGDITINPADSLLTIPEAAG